MQFEAAGAPLQLPGSSAASRFEQSGQATDGSSSAAAVKGSELHAQTLKTTRAEDIAQAQQSAAGKQAKVLSEQQSVLFSNPTFESYLDSYSDDGLAPVEGCTTPRSAIKQQASCFLLLIP